MMEQIYTQNQRKGGGGMMNGGPVSRRDRGISRKKCPPFDEADVGKSAPAIQKSWARALELRGYFELGNLYYDTVFSDAPDIAPLFTLERERMGAKFVDMFGVSPWLGDLFFCRSPSRSWFTVRHVCSIHHDGMRGVNLRPMDLM